MAKLIPTVLDYETYWSTTHSLTKMVPMDYVMHPETELISLSFKFGEDKTYCIFGEDRIDNWVQSVDWSDKYAIGHNMSGFDAMILAWRHGVTPAMYGCTLAMARPIFAKTVGLSLAKLVQHYKLGFKDQTVLHNTRGRHLKDFTPAEIAAMHKYNSEDTEQTFGLFKKLLPLTSNDELRLIDLTIRMLVNPQFEVDVPLLETTLVEERKRKVEVLLDLSKMIGVFQEGRDDSENAEAVCTVLGSAAKFGALLRELGAEVPTKISPTTGKVAPALAKTDEGFLALTESENPILAAAANARLGVKSTLLESRLAAFIGVSKAVGGKLPVPLKYYGADTTGRWSGWAYNPQNLPRIGSKKKPSDALRMCLRAPAGHKVVVADLSGIELRVNMFLWKVRYAMDLFIASPDKADLYKYFAAHELYNCDEGEVTKDQRQVGKVSHLGLGFGAGAPTFQKVARLMGGINMPLQPAVQPLMEYEDGSLHPMDVDEFLEWKAEQPLSAEEVVNAYRAGHPEIVQGWRTCQKALRDIFMGVERPIDPWGLCWTCAEGIRTPVGMIRYPDLRQEDVSAGFNPDGTEKFKKEWVYGQGRNKARIYAGKVVENIVQHLARGVVAGNMLNAAKRPVMKAYPPALTVHDELVYVPREEHAVEVLDAIQTEMRTPPAWWPELITWSEGDIADTYGEAK